MSGLQPDGFSHSEICGSKVICTSPQLFAAYHVLHRLWEPRHPPYALFFFLVLRRHVPHHIIYKEGDTLSILSVLIPCHKKGQGTLYFRFSCFVSLCQRPCPENIPEKWNPTDSDCGVRAISLDSDALNRQPYIRTQTDV